MAWTVETIKAKNREAGQHFFDGDTMRFFRSRVEREVFEGPGGVFLVTSEQFVMGEDTRPREWTVRRFDPETGGVATVEGANDLTRASALRCARELADGIAIDRLTFIRRVGAEEVGREDWSETDEKRSEDADVETFRATLRRELSSQFGDVVNAWAGHLINWGRALHQYAEDDCNGILTPAQAQQRAQVERKVAGSCEAWGCKAVIQDDPRGAVLHIALPSGETYGDLGGRGLAVPYHAGWKRPE